MRYVFVGIGQAARGAIISYLSVSEGVVSKPFPPVTMAPELLDKSV